MFQIWRISQGVLVTLLEVRYESLDDLCGWSNQSTIFDLYFQGLTRSYVPRDVSTLVMTEGPRPFCVTNSNAFCAVDFG